MLKFFRNIRRKLLDEGQLRKYLVYAIGEILLVMIGILLALQVNNWNENNKKEAIEYQALKDLRQEFKRNMNDFNRVQSIRKTAYTNLLSHLDYIFNNEHISINNPQIIRPESLGTPSWNLANPVLHGLAGNGTIMNFSNDSLKYLLLSWDEISENYTDVEDIYINITIPELQKYERAKVPLDIYLSGSEAEHKYHNEYKYYDESQIANYYGQVITEMEYRNNIKACITNLTILMKTGQLVEDTFAKIDDMLKSEIRKFEG